MDVLNGARLPIAGQELVRLHNRPSNNSDSKACIVEARMLMPP